MVVPEQRWLSFHLSSSALQAGMGLPQDMLADGNGKFGCGTLLKTGEFWGGFSVLYFL